MLGRYLFTLSNSNHFQYFEYLTGLVEIVAYSEPLLSFFILGGNVGPREQEVQGVQEWNLQRPSLPQE